MTGNKFRTNNDQPIVSSVVWHYQFPNHWSLGLTWYYHKGSPSTPLLGTESVDESDPSQGVTPIFGQFNSTRLPDYHRLDVRIAKPFFFSDWKLAANFEIINLYNRKNVLNYQYSNQYQTRRAKLQLPLLISFGLIASF